MAAPIRRVCCSFSQSILKNIRPYRKAHTLSIFSRTQNSTKLQQCTYSSQADGDLASTDEPEYPNVEVSKEDFKYVERLLPKMTVPPPPADVQFPTPSGWIPPSQTKDLPYNVKRTKNHMLPVYLVKNKDGQLITRIAKVEGDMFELNRDLKAYLKEKTKGIVLTQVYEATRIIRVRGNKVREVADFLLAKGY